MCNRCFTCLDSPCFSIQNIKTMPWIIWRFILLKYLFVSFQKMELLIHVTTVIEKLRVSFGCMNDLLVVIVIFIIVMHWCSIMFYNFFNGKTLYFLVTIKNDSIDGSTIKEYVIIPIIWIALKYIIIVIIVSDSLCVFIIPPLLWLQ